ncbi:MAG: hypothetical protein HQK66_12150 [Desulfamplus sp.]|nr:hypothetical protein [Desulfamplus sp.]
MIDSLMVTIIVVAATICCTVNFKKIVTGEKKSGCTSGDCRSCGCSSGGISSKDGSIPTEAGKGFRPGCTS